MNAHQPQSVFRTRPAHFDVDGPLYGVAPETAIRTLGDVTRYHAERRPNCVAAWFEGRRTSYAELDSRANRIAQALLSKGLRKDDRIVYAGKNSDRYFELLFGCAKAGVVLVPVSWRFSARELAYIVRDCGAKLVFADESTAEAVATIASEFTCVMIFVAMEQPVNGWPEFSAWYGAYPDKDPMVPVESSEAAVQLYTSGTTGRPKGTQLTHNNLTSAFFRPMASGEPCAQWSDDDVSLVLLPIAHISGTGGGFLGYCAGATNVVVRDFEPANVLRLIVALGVSKLVLVPAAIKLLLDHPDVAGADFSRLHHILYGASPIPLDLLRAAIRVFGCGLCQAYGMTETTGPIVYLPPEDHDPNGNQRMRGAGKPYPHVRLRIRRFDGTLAATGETGEIETRSEHNMLGYWNLPEQTRDAYSRDGWLKTGDAGYLDADGYLYVQDRIKEKIISDGENIYQAEAEITLFGYPDVANVSVIGVPDDTWGEAVKAVVVRRACR